jgi:hypothetical protein
MFLDHLLTYIYIYNESFIWVIVCQVIRQPVSTILREAERFYQLLPHLYYTHTHTHTHAHPATHCWIRIVWVCVKLVFIGRFGGLHISEWFIPGLVTVNKPRIQEWCAVPKSKVVITTHFNVYDLLFTIIFFTCGSRWGRLFNCVLS